MTRRYYFIVSGAGQFPFHMLCLDEAWPADLDAAEKIVYACPTQAPVQEIGLESFSPPNIKRWQEARWPVKLIA